MAWAKRQGVDTELVESFVADPMNECWADFVAVFRRSSPHPWMRRGRIADVTRASNIHDGGQGDPPPLERESWATYDMRQTALLTAKLEAAEQRVEQLQAALAEQSAGLKWIAARWFGRHFSTPEA